MAKSRPNPKVVAWLDSCEEGDVYVSVLTLGEIQKGIARLAGPKWQNAGQHWLDGGLRPRFAGRILPVDEAVALTWGLIQVEVDRRRQSVPTIDGLLGATAIAANLVVVTRNEGASFPPVRGF